MPHIAWTHAGATFALTDGDIKKLRVIANRNFGHGLQAQLEAALARYDRGEDVTLPGAFHHVPTDDNRKIE